MNPTVEMRIGAVFSQNDYDVGVARLLIVARQTAVVRDLLKTLHDPADCVNERSVVLLTYYIAAIKELADAFDYLRARGIVGRIAAPDNNFIDLRDSAQTALKHLDDKNPKSLYCTFLKRVRDTTAFHVQLPKVREAIGMLGDVRMPATSVVGDKQTVTAIPFVKAALAIMSFTNPEELRHNMDVAMKLHAAIDEVAHDLYLINVRVATEITMIDEPRSE